MGWIKTKTGQQVVRQGKKRKQRLSIYNVRYRRDDCVIQAFNCNFNTLRDILLNCVLINITKA